MERYCRSNETNINYLLCAAICLLLVQRNKTLPFFLPSFVFLLFSIASDDALFEKRPRIFKKKPFKVKL